MLDEVSGGLSPPSPSSSPPLFRREALAAAAQTGLGQPVTRLPVTWRLMTAAFAVMAGAFLWILLVGTYTRRETVAGVVRADGGAARIVVPTSGIIKSINVMEGQAVKKGQRLLEVETKILNSSGVGSDVRAVAQIQGEISLLQARQRALQTSTATEATGISERLSALSQEEAAALSQIQSTGKRLELAERTLEKLRPVASKGFISGDAMRRREEEVIVLGQAIADAKAARARVTGQKADLLTAKARNPLTLLQEQGQLAEAISRLQRELATYQNQQGFVLIAPIDGVVTALQASPGQPADPQRTLLSITPQSPKIKAEIFVPSRAAGFIKPGHKVRVRYDAFPFQRFGIATGHVQSVSTVILKPQDIESPLKIEEPVYRVMIVMDKSTIEAYGNEYIIRSGFALSADIILEERTFASWLFDPIEALRGRL